jgi:co-chaperonin GroES (HSP10)
MGNVSGVHPVNNHALVQLGQLMQLSKVHVPVGKYDTHTTGTVLEADYDFDHKQLAEMMVGKEVYFSEFKEGTKFTKDGVEYAFIKLDDIEGYIEQID